MTSTSTDTSTSTTESATTTLLRHHIDYDQLFKMKLKKDQIIFNTFQVSSTDM